MHKIESEMISSYRLRQSVDNFVKVALLYLDRCSSEDQIMEWIYQNSRTHVTLVATHKIATYLGISEEELVEYLRHRIIQHVLNE